MTPTTFNPGKGAGSTVGIAILGYGTVGSQVLRLMVENADEFAHRTGGPLEVRGVAVSNKEKHVGTLADELGLLTDDARSLIKRDDVDLVVEVIGGIDYPRELVLSALRPVVGPLRRSLAGDQVQSVAGIVNGTTNFILDAMDSTGASYDDMLAEATRLGYAEADPTADVEGYDAASKAAILASLAFHTRVTADDVHCEGITNITAHDIQAAKAAGYTIKLLAICDRLKDEAGHESIAARVHPTLVPRNHPLANVHKSFNAVFVEAEAAGRLMFYGNGAGGNPTASAVLGDIVGAGRNKVFGGRAPGESTYANLPIANFGDIPTRFHIDMTVVDIIGVLAELTKIFAAHGISLRTVRQEEGTEKNARLLVMTHEAKESDLAATVETLKDTPSVIKVNSVIRMVGE